MSTALLRPQWILFSAENFDENERNLIFNAYALIHHKDSQYQQKIQSLCQLLINLKSDATIIAAGLLVGSWRAKELEEADISNSCNPRVLTLLKALDNLTLIDDLHEQDKSDLEQLRKMLLAMASDMRAVILKLALQVLAMRNIQQYDPKYQQRLALQTRDLFAPLANRMGIAQLKWELEDSALMILESDIYQELSLALEEKRVDRERYITRIIHYLEHQFKLHHLPVDRIYGRVKHINSIYQKMKRKHLQFSQVNDIRAVRIEVDTEQQCYEALSVINSLWVPIADEFDDYIANPKPNGYQSLHCTVIGPEDKILEVQIRTTQMHDNAELGIAAHWKYKEKNIRHSLQFEKQIEWLRRMLEGKGDDRRGDLVFDQFRNEAFKDRVYAITPEGKVIDLPEGATPLDFAYHIHTQLGHRCRGAKINQHIVPLTTAIKNGDTVEILTQKEGNPSPDWLSDHLGYLHSARAKAKLRSYFKKMEKEKSIEIGRDIFLKEQKRLNVTVSSDILETLISKLNLNSENDFYAAIGFSDINILNVMHELTALAQLKESDEKESLKSRISKVPIRASHSNNESSVIIEGVSDMLVNFASCCQPLPPSEIVGFITQGRGINIHQRNCQNIIHLAKVHPERIVEPHWNLQDSGIFAIDIAITFFDRSHIIRDITQVFTNERVPILHADMKLYKDDNLRGEFKIEISDMGQLSRIFDRLYQIKDVIQAHRI